MERTNTLTVVAVPGANMPVEGSMNGMWWLSISTAQNVCQPAVTPLSETV